MSAALVRSVVSATPIVRAAIAATEKEYWDKLCATRSAKDPACSGSFFPFTPELISRAMLELEWEPYTHAAVHAPATAFIAQHFSGYINVVHIDALPFDMRVSFEDPKGTGALECVCRAVSMPEGVLPAGILVDFIVMIIGPHEGKDVVWTFHPGDPIPPSSLRLDQLSKESYRVKEAKALGVEWVKLARPVAPVQVHEGLSS